MSSVRTAARLLRAAWTKRSLLAARLDALAPPDGPDASLAPPPPIPDAPALRAWQRDFYVPSIPVQDPRPVTAPFMAFSTCSAGDFLHPEFRRVSHAIGQEPHFHRKFWEYAYIYHHLTRLGVVGPGSRGIGFGVGSEPLPAAFAALGADIVATDAPAQIGERAGWTSSAQYAAGFDSLRWAGITDEATMRRRVSFAECDMTDPPPELTGFDFCWSACCFEHLGSLDAGAAFVLDSVERMLRPGGIAVHTTEFNLSSNERTLEGGPTVIYRRRDMEALLSELRRRGHTVLQDFSVAPDTPFLDGFVDVPPYTHNPHLKLALDDFIVTSVGLIVQRRADD